MGGGGLGCPVVLVSLCTVSSVSWDSASCHFRGHAVNLWPPPVRAGCAGSPWSQTVPGGPCGRHDGSGRGAAQEPVSGVLRSTPHGACHTLSSVMSPATVRWVSSSHTVVSCSVGEVELGLQMVILNEGAPPWVTGGLESEC